MKQLKHFASIIFDAVFFFQTSVNDIFFFKQVLMTYLILLRGVTFKIEIYWCVAQNDSTEVPYPLCIFEMFIVLVSYKIVIFFSRTTQKRLRRNIRIYMRNLSLRLWRTSAQGIIKECSCRSSSRGRGLYEPCTNLHKSL